jgi:hypothetical protein
MRTKQATVGHVGESSIISYLSCSGRHFFVSFLHSTSVKTLLWGERAGANREWDLQAEGGGMGETRIGERSGDH